MTRSILAFRFAVLALAMLWWLPTIVLMFGHLAWREVRLQRRFAQVRRLRRAGRFDEATAALDRLRRDMPGN